MALFFLSIHFFTICNFKGCLISYSILKIFRLIDRNFDNEFIRIRIWFSIGVMDPVCLEDRMRIWLISTQAQVDINSGQGWYQPKPRYINPGPGWYQPRPRLISTQVLVDINPGPGWYQPRSRLISTQVQVNINPGPNRQKNCTANNITIKIFMY